MYTFLYNFFVKSRPRKRLKRKHYDNTKKEILKLYFKLKNDKNYFKTKTN